MPSRLRGLLGLLAVLLVSCKKEAAAPPAPPPAKVEFTSVEKRDVPVIREWVATMDGSSNAQIKAQVQGYLQKRTYVEGSYVRKGAILFEIDPRPFQAALNRSKGQVEQALGNVRRAEGDFHAAEAELGKTDLDVKRFTPLAKSAAISQQELDNAIQANLASRASVEASKASIEAAKSAVESARSQVEELELQLAFTNITAPIDGIVGIAQAQVGDLVSPASGALAVISTVDPIKAYFTVPEQQYIEYNRALEVGARRAPEDIRFELVLADGSVFPRTGRFLAVDREVDVTTGSIRLAALFPNPGRLLRPGAFGRIRASVNVEKDMAVIPQRAVTELQGSYMVAVIGADNKISIRPVKMGERIGSDWVVREGLRPGDRVVAEGTQKIRDGATVNPVPFESKTPKS